MVRTYKRRCQRIQTKEVHVNWIASSDDFVRHIEVYVKDKHPNARVTQDSGIYRLQMTGLGGLVALQIHPGHPVSVSFIKSSPRSTHQRPIEKFPYAEASLKPIAQAICSWIEARSREAVKIVE